MSGKESNLNILYILGTRPEILKMNSVIKLSLIQGHKSTVLHTGQHYDHEMSSVFFSDLDLPEPDIFLGIGSDLQGAQVANAIIEIENYLITNIPDLIMVVGDTNAGVSGALAACKLGIPVVHLEAGARSFDWAMPEEINRRIIDSVARYCFAPTESCFQQLVTEGRKDFSWLVGDTLVETALEVMESVIDIPEVMSKYDLEDNNYGILTIHRAENTNNLKRLKEILKAINDSEVPILFPAHPRTLKTIKDNNLETLTKNIAFVKPQPYKDFLTLLKLSRFVVTDSGGVQQEASIFCKNCLTVRNNTEWINTIEAGNNKLVRADRDEIVKEIKDIMNNPNKDQGFSNPFKVGASQKILEILMKEKKSFRLNYPSSNFID